MLITFIIFSFSIKEWFYQHEKYGIDSNFEATTITYPENSIKFKIDFTEKLKSKSNLLITNFTVEFEKNFLDNRVTFLDIKTEQILNDKKFSNRNIKKILKKEINYINSTEFIDKLFADFLFYKIKIPQKEINVGEIWSDETKITSKIKDEIVIKRWIKFLGYRNSENILKITEIIEIKEPFPSNKIFTGTGESIITIKNGEITNIEKNIDIDFEKYIKTTKFTLKKIE
ncbi:hypothetical protein JXR93_05840 [bacterium]|nr:hypothetical protein [bacterium]